MTEFMQFFGEAFLSIFIAINPLAVVAIFISMTPEFNSGMRLKLAKLACLVALGVMICFALTGKLMFDYLGISQEAFRIAGGVLLGVIGFEMLRGQEPQDLLTAEECEAALQKKDIAITPLAVPMIVGPGCLSATLGLESQVHGAMQQWGLGAAIVVVCVALYALFVVTSAGAKWLTKTILKLSYRLSGLVLMAIALQFCVTGLQDAAKAQEQKKAEAATQAAAVKEVQQPQVSEASK